ncbi:hypothetical protein JMJ35_004153 [Cladonia borealis]|uniref:NADPH-dependent diflavin oxidoreductase 1 n=1 Tax=Cladonia borealis TaxID=184061 RepID=A0AA39R1H1_9LECA|nr:hypothetical protein JMJ35_004153 [Cladonia borealis]
MDKNNQSQDRSALIAYGSETGNANDYAEELGRVLERIRFRTHVSELDAIDSSSLNNYSIVIIITSTTGQGDLPANARLFWKRILRKKLPPGHLKAARFTTFGLGDSSYPKFNWAARKLHKRLLQLGANEIYERGEADEQHEEGLDASFVPWSLDLRRHLLTMYPLPFGVEPIPEEVLLEPKWILATQPSYPPNPSPHGEDEALLHVNGAAESSSMSNSAPSLDPRMRLDPVASHLTVTLDENRRMTAKDHWQDVRHLSFTSHAPAAYGPGDVLTIYPKNSTKDVNELLRRMDWMDVADINIHLTATNFVDGDGFYPSPTILPPGESTTLRKLLTEGLDPTAIPRRSFFSLIAHFTEDQFHKDRLLEFTKPEYIDELYDYTTRPRRSILEVLQEFESVKIPWQWAANVLPKLRGRQFSIASGGQLKKTPDGNAKFDLLVAIVKYKTVIKKIREGVCTRYLATLSVGTEIRVGLQKGGLVVNESEACRPVLMIGPGTGVAPMRSLIKERQLWLQQAEALTHGETGKYCSGAQSTEKDVLIFGCRNQQADYYYRDEWKLLMQQVPLAVFTAFSRDQDHKFYVQDVIRQQASSVHRLLVELGGIVYVCGSSGKMPKAVRAALADVFRKEGNVSERAAERYLESMEKEGRYQQETW